MSEESPCHQYVTDEELEKRLRQELETIRGEVNDLYNTVYKGNGTPSLVTRMNSVEGKLRGLRDTMDERISHINRENTLKFESIHDKLENKFGRLEGMVSSKFQDLEKDLTGVADAMRDLNTQVYKSDNIDRAGRWQLKAAIITAAISLFVGLSVLFWS